MILAAEFRIQMRGPSCDDKYPESSRLQWGSMITKLHQDFFSCLWFDPFMHAQWVKSQRKSSWNSDIKICYFCMLIFKHCLCVWALLSMSHMLKKKNTFEMESCRKWRQFWNLFVRNSTGEPSGKRSGTRNRVDHRRSNKAEHGTPTCA